MRPDATPHAGRPGTPARAEPDPDGRWYVLAILSVALLFGMSAWFSATAVAPQLAVLWSLTERQAAWLTTIVQLGFVTGAAVAGVLNLADVLPARRYFSASAVLAAVVTAAVLVAPGYEAALALRFLTGFFLAGVYPPAMKMVATWFRSGRGLAIGVLVGALSVGKALPYVVRAIEGASVEFVALTSAGGALLAAVLVGGLYRDGPFPFARRPFSWSLSAVVAAHRPTRLAIGGYLGHMWELYAMWALVAVFFADFFVARGLGSLQATAYAGGVAFAVISAGGLGAVLAGAWADRLGRERVTIWSLAASGSCALVMGWLITAPAWLVVPLALFWGFAVVADSAQFSALVTEVAPGHAAGTALTLQTCVGFLLTAFTIWLAVELRSLAGWPVAFGMLAIGPAAGIVAMARLRTLRQNVRGA